MIKLSDLLEEAVNEQETIDELNVGKAARTAALAAGLGLATLGTPKKGLAQQPTQTTQVAKKAPTGTSVDGVLGQFTSQFKFPKAFEKSGTKITDLGIEGNTALRQLTSFDTTKMKEWNKFVDWMENSKINGAVIKGNPVLDTDRSLGRQVIDTYRKTKQGSNFWVKKDSDIEIVQDLIKAYRTLTIAQWKLGAKQKGAEHAEIKLGGVEMDPTKKEDVSRVESEYMKWAKD